MKGNQDETVKLGKKW